MNTTQPNEGGRMQTTGDYERAISRLLAEFETKFGTLVRAVRIEDVEITDLVDDRRMFARRVVIESERVPGSRWEQ